MRRLPQAPTQRRRARAPSPPVRALLECLSEGAALVAVDGRVGYANPAFTRLLGRSLLDAVPPPRRAEVAALLARREGSFELERIAVTLHPAPDAPWVCVSVLDLSERKQREVVVENTRLARAVLQSAAEPIVVLNPRGRVIRCSRAAIDLCGTNPMHRPFEEAFPLVVEPDLWTGSSILTALQWGQTLRGVPVVMTRADGRRFDLILGASAMRDREGRIERAVVSLTEDPLRFLSEAGDLLASSLDVEATLARLADMLVPRIADRCALDLEGRRIATVPADATFPDPLETPALQHSFISVPLRIRNRGIGHLRLGSDREFTERDFDLAKDLARRIATAVDNARLYREAQDAVRLREEFISMASHELRTPLTALKLTLAVIERGGGGIADAKRHSDSMARLISDLLDISKMISRRLEVVREDADLAAIVREAAGRLGVRIRAPRAVRGRWDRLRLDQVATNLLSNAIKYGEGREIDVRVRVAKGGALLEVRDRGRGIGPEELPRVFEPFFRADSAKGRPGLGMGLYITRQIVEAHGGRIEIASRVGEGTTVLVTLPRN